ANLSYKTCEDGAPARVPPMRLLHTKQDRVGMLHHLARKRSRDIWFDGILSHGLNGLIQRLPRTRTRLIFRASVTRNEFRCGLRCPGLDSKLLSPAANNSLANPFVPQHRSRTPRAAGKDNARRFESIPARLRQRLKCRPARSPANIFCS